jgi:hypothetical protein
MKQKISFLTASKFSEVLHGMRLDDARALLGYWEFLVDTFPHATWREIFREICVFARELRVLEGEPGLPFHESEMLRFKKR